MRGRFYKNEFFIVAVGCFGPETTGLESEYTGKGDTADEVGGCQVEGALSEGAGKRVFESMGRERVEPRKDAWNVLLLSE